MFYNQPLTFSELFSKSDKSLIQVYPIWPTRLGLALLVSMVLFLAIVLPKTANAAGSESWNSVPTSQVVIKQSNPVRNRRNNDATVDVSFTNISGKNLAGPFRLVVKKLDNLNSDIKVSAANSSSTTTSFCSGGCPYYNLTPILGANFAAGKTALFRITVVNGGVTNFNLSVVMEQQYCSAPTTLRNDVCVIPESGVVGTAGGIVEIVDTNSPIYRAKILLPRNALYESETVSIGYQENIPEPFNADSIALGAKQLGKTLVLNRSGSSSSSLDFGESATVTIPYDKLTLPINAVPIVIYWDDANNTYSPVTVTSIDRNQGLVTFKTAHASEYVLLYFQYQLNIKDNSDLIPLSVHAGSPNNKFDPNVDGFYTPNFGAFNDEGHCFGIAAFSAMYHAQIKEVVGTPLINKYREGGNNDVRDDQLVRELLVRVDSSGDQAPYSGAIARYKDNFLYSKERKDMDVAMTLIEQMKVTNQAQILGLEYRNKTDGTTSGHAVTVYAYDGLNKVFKYYDSNMGWKDANNSESIRSDSVRTIRWTPTEGFGNYSSSKEVVAVGFTSFNESFSPGRLFDLYFEAESGFSKSLFPEVLITSPQASMPNSEKYESLFFRNVILEGQVARPQQPAYPLNPYYQSELWTSSQSNERYVHVYLNGQQYKNPDTNYPGGGFPVGNIKGQDHFEIPIDLLPGETTEVMLLISENPEYWSANFHAYKKFTIHASLGWIKSIGITENSGYYDHYHGASLSSDGSVFYYHDDNDNPLRWTSSTAGLQMLNLGGLFGDFRLRGASPNGKVIVGSSLNYVDNAPNIHGHSVTHEAVRWTNSEGTQALGRLNRDLPSIASAASTDGEVIVGVAEMYGIEDYAFVWSADTGMVALTPPERNDLAPNVGIGWSDSEAVDVSSNGNNVLVNTLYREDNKFEAFVWRGGNSWQRLGMGLWAFDMSADGNTVVGTTVKCNGVEQAFIWTPNGGMECLGGLNIPEAQGQAGKTWAYAVSGDGSVVVGHYEFQNGSHTNGAFIWDRTHGMRDLTDLIAGQVLEDLPALGIDRLWDAIAISDDGQTIAGHFYNNVDPNGSNTYIAHILPIPHP